VNVRIQKSRKDDWLSHWEAFNYVPFRKKMTGASRKFRLLVEAALCTSFSGTDISNSKKATDLNNAVT